MSSGILLIVGLGNPGAEYELTRHNAGAWFVSALADDANISMRFNPKFQGMHGIASIKGHDCHLLIPTTFMNLSGQSVQALATYYKIPPQSILVAHDELDVPVGTVRLKYDGGHGGHNGLRDIIRHLSTNQFHRLRIGVGHPGTGRDVANYVLAAPKKADREAIDTALRHAEGILPFVMKGEFQKAMHFLHTT
ncbi:MAG: aminoacyl-tRNA hydrolase [Gammaproteobacteria bacterium]|nr:aminoacyl-tRNA hydrolase [Gammaproteobacteria bacterium]